jgi:hypothetical protein
MVSIYYRKLKPEIPIYIICSTLRMRGKNRMSNEPKEVNKKVHAILHLLNVLFS